jgi:hypothetical protein
MDPPTTDLDLRRFEADAAFSTALAELQAGEPAATIAAEAKRAVQYGFSWFTRPSLPDGFQMVLRHEAGAAVSAHGASPTALLAGLLGHPLAHDWAPAPAVEAAEPDPGAAAEPSAAPAAEPEQQSTEEADPSPDQAAPAAAQVAAESLAAATSGVVVAEVDEAERLAAPLTDRQKAVCIEMIKALGTEQRKAFTIAFRDAFRVPREAKAIAPLIVELRHLEFCDRWSVEAAGGVAP